MNFEYLENVEKIFVSLPTNHQQNCRIEIKRNSMEISTNAQSKKVFGLDLHSFEFIPNSCRIDQIQKEEGWILFSLGMRSLNGKGIVHQRPSDELFNDDDDVPSRDKKYPNQFSCAVCRDTFVSNFQAQKFLPLPSDYWYEMTECWACHHEDYTTLPGQVGGQVFAQKNVLLAGISYYLLHPTHLDLDKIHIRLTGREVSYELSFNLLSIIRNRKFKEFRAIEITCFGGFKFPKLYKIMLYTKPIS